MNEKLCINNFLHFKLLSKHLKSLRLDMKKFQMIYSKLLTCPAFNFMWKTLHFEFRNFGDASLKYFTKLTPELYNLINSRVSINIFQTFQGFENFAIFNFDSKFMNFLLTHCKCLLSYYKLCTPGFKILYFQTLQSQLQAGRIYMGG